MLDELSVSMVIWCHYLNLEALSSGETERMFASIRELVVKTMKARLKQKDGRSAITSARLGLIRLSCACGSSPWRDLGLVSLPFVTVCPKVAF